MEIILRIERGAAEARERRDELADAIEDLARGMVSIATTEPGPYEGTAALVDLGAPDLRLGNRTETVTQILRYEANVNIFSAVDQMRGFAVLLRAERSLMGAVSVARGVFEACLWSAAVLDPTLTTDERLQRALTRRLARLSAGIRLGHLLGKSGGIAANEQSHPVPARDKDEPDDEHGSNRDPAQDVQDITDYAIVRGWTVEKRRRAYVINERLSIDWLAENLERRIGLEHYAWSSGSSMAHGEHAADTASWLALSPESGLAPAWLIRLWSTGAWAGPRLFLATYAEYTGCMSLSSEYQRFERAFWDVGPR